MHTTNIPIEAAINDTETGSSTFYRHFCSRNLRPGRQAEVSQADRTEQVPFDNNVILSAQKGALVAKRNAIPTLLSLAFMGSLAWAFYSIPTVHAFFAQVSVLKQNMGISFAILVSGLCVGILSECFALTSSQKHRWTMQNTVSFAFLFLTYGIMLAAKEPVFVLLENLYGADKSLPTLFKKTLFDQFAWTVFLACPYQTLLFSWKNHGYSFQSMKQESLNFSDFFAAKMLPVLISSWAFWIPMSVIIYSFPTELQLTVSIIAISLWVGLLNRLPRSSQL